MENKRKYGEKKDPSFAKKRENFKKLGHNSKKKDFKKNDDKFKKKENFKVNKEMEKVEETPASNVRYYIYKCLYNIYVNKAFSNIEIDHVIRENHINELDAKLLTNVV